MEMLLTHNSIVPVRLNPKNEAAKKGLERLEKQMKVCLLFCMLQSQYLLHLSSLNELLMVLAQHSCNPVENTET